MNAKKRQLRNLVRARLKELPSNVIDDQSGVIAKRLFELDEFKRAKKIGIYMNMPHSEVRTMNIIKKCFDNKMEVFLPRCNFQYSINRKRGYLTFLKVNTLDSVLSLTPQGPWKLLEPTKGKDLMKTGGFDVLILPGVAFSSKRKRLGHGGGYYDEFLSYYQSTFHHKPYLIGLGLNEQLVDHIPSEDHDWILDCIITPKLVVTDS